MKLAFAVWSACAVLFFGLAAHARRAKGAVGFIAGVCPPAVRDAVGYNRAVARLWAVFTALFELAGLPLMFARQNSPAVVLCVLGTATLAIGAMIAYSRIEGRYGTK